MPATSLQQLKIPRGYRGDWPLQEYALIDAVEATINEIEVARGSNTSLAAELEETYATKSYVQLAIADPNVNDIYVSDLAVKLSEAGLVGYTLQVQPGNTLAFTNTYTLGNGTLANPAIKFNSSVSAGLLMSYDGTHETMSVKLNGGVALDIVHDKVSGANVLELGTFKAYSDGDVEGTDATLRRLTTTGTGIYSTNLAEVTIGSATIGTLSVTETATLGGLAVIGGTTLYAVSRNLNTSVLSGGFNVNSLNAITREYMCTGCINTPEELGPGFYSDGMLSVYAGAGTNLNGKAIQVFLSFTTTALAIRYWSGSAWNNWRVLSKETGNANVPFYVGEATDAFHAMRKVDVETAIGNAIPSSTTFMPVVAGAKVLNTAGATVQYQLLANVATVTRVSFGWDVTFNSTIPSTYIVVGNVSSYSPNSFTFEPTNQTSSGFHIRSVSSTAPAFAPPDGAELNFIVHST